ncbi:GNAT family N-acetyltransferase [Sinorhizobium meliloti]|uniref:GNAT family N-acetyltransferase n=1 Tax=Rhizobium meliloti TaxID=382 RepID=UPI000B4A2D8A|nr:GNAT family N-acetyltransferase [Sinorhizobium meliloti]ASP68617.1 GNAT family N-acetyltransferase [Sinorhizobium meliloti]MQX04590.1 GNAT family N-acetyltransferase [Sinorhizobium meliloti]RVG01747.1 GNAT family N-acetyltransferase [Sinorhizobium meliloti]RVK41462.1 GNAT family N-acetyltransferase [Sinorhizobium meliloti]
MACQILPADESLLAEIEIWLDAEEAIFQRALQTWEEADYEGDRPVRGFRCNWDSAKEGWREGRARIHVLVANGEAIGFLDGTDILEIRPDHRGNGYGRILADFMIQTVWEDGRSVVEIEIAPSSAEPFWLHMGFKLVEDRQGYGGGTFAYKILPRTLELGDGERVKYAIAFFTDKARYSEDPKPFAKFVGEGERLADGSIQLPERAYCFNPLDDQHVDYFVKIEVDGDVVHFDKAKYEESALCGVQRDAAYDFYIERINPGHGCIVH